MGFLTPMYELGQYLNWTRSGEIQLPDFQRGFSSRYCAAIRSGQ